MEFLLVMVAAAAVIVIVSAPFRRGGAGGAGGTGAAEAEEAPVKPDVADLEAAREAKYREIRDAELDHQTGKLSDEDFRLVDDALRAEAISILRALDRAKGSQAR
ncbi:MAG: hypothetical protein QOJ25_882 [Solirubrobacteraceae bacterium]|jgi:hypothetical protein|nr:hypothetical protein [Solirubrobacteraceae bacterium]